MARNHKGMLDLHVEAKHESQDDIAHETMFSHPVLIRKGSLARERVIPFTNRSP